MLEMDERRHAVLWCFQINTEGILKINKYEPCKAPFADQQKGVKEIITGTSFAN